MDTFDSFEAMLEGFGASLIERTRLTFGADVLKASADVKPQNGRVLIATDQRASDMFGKLNPDASKRVRLVSAVGTDPSKVRAHVANYAKSRKVRLVLNPIKQGDDVIGYSAHRA